LARTYRQLELNDRRTLFRLIEARTPVGEIAARLGRHPSTIYRELGRNRFRDGDGPYLRTERCTVIRPCGSRPRKWGS
jgi:transposase, IS30 family